MVKPSSLSPRRARALDRVARAAQVQHQTQHHPGGDRLRPLTPGQHQHQRAGEGRPQIQRSEQAHLPQRRRQTAPQKEQARLRDTARRGNLLRLQPGTEPRPVQPGGQGDQRHLHRLPRQVCPAPPLGGQGEQPGKASQQGAAHRQKPGPAVDGQVVKGKGEGIDQNRGGHIAQTADQAQVGQISQAGPDEGAEAPRPGAGGRHKAQGKGGVAVHHPGQGQRRPQGQTAPALQQDGDCRLAEEPLPPVRKPPSGLSPGPGKGSRFHSYSPRLLDEMMIPARPGKTGREMARQTGNRGRSSNKIGRPSGKGGRPLSKRPF